MRVGEALTFFARAAHAPRWRCASIQGVRDGARGHARRPWTQQASAERLRPGVARSAGATRSAAVHELPDPFDSSATQKLLDKARIRVSPLEDYAWRLWDYWERHLDPDSIDRSLKGAVKGKVVVITADRRGSASAAAIRIADGKVVIVARDEEKLAEVRQDDNRPRRVREDLLLRHHRLRRERQAGARHPRSSAASMS